MTEFLQKKLQKNGRKKFDCNVIDVTKYKWLENLKILHASIFNWARAYLHSTVYMYLLKVRQKKITL